MPHDFTQGSVGKKLVLFALPIMAGMLLHTAYNIVDAIFIGMLGPNELAAVSLTFPVIFVFMNGVRILFNINCVFISLIETGIFI